MSETTTPKRTQADRTRERKEQLIREATRLFGQYGFRGARLADIAKAAEVTEPGLLHHFPSKEHLLMGVLEERDRADRERFSPTQPDADGNMLDALQALVEHNETVPGLVQLFTVLVAESITPEHPGHEFFVNRYRGLRTQFVDAIRQAQAKGQIRTDLRAEDLTVMIWALMDGLQLQWLLDPDEVRMGEVFGAFVGILRV